MPAVLANGLVLALLVQTLAAAALDGSAGSAIFKESAINPRDESSKTADAVLTNGAWTHDKPSAHNAYLASLLSMYMYQEHLGADTVGEWREKFCALAAAWGASECRTPDGAGGMRYAVLYAEPSVLLIFRGTDSPLSNPADWIINFGSLHTERTDQLGGGPGGIQVAAGWLKLVLANMAGILDALDLRSAGASVEGALWVMGHSMGAAEAQIAAQYITEHTGMDVRGVYTYGSPRVGDSSWVRAYNLQHCTTRYEVVGDLVTSLPFGPSWRTVGSARTASECRGQDQGSSGDAMKSDAAAVAFGAAVADVALASVQQLLHIVASAASGANNKGHYDSGRNMFTSRKLAMASKHLSQLLFQKAAVEEERTADLELGGAVANSKHSKRAADTTGSGLRPNVQAKEHILSDAATADEQGSKTTPTDGMAAVVESIALLLRGGEAAIQQEHKQQPRVPGQDIHTADAASTVDLQAGKAAHTIAASGMHFGIDEHRIDTYARYLYSCLSDDDQQLLPPPRSAV